MPSTMYLPELTATLELFDASDNSLGSATAIPDIFPLPGGGESDFVENQITLDFSGVAAYGVFRFEGPATRAAIDNFLWTQVPAPATASTPPS